MLSLWNRCENLFLEALFLRVSMQYHPRLTLVCIVLTMVSSFLSSRTVWSHVKSRSSSYWPTAWKKVNNSINSNRRAEPATKGSNLKTCPAPLQMSVMSTYDVGSCSYPPPQPKDSVIIVTIFKFNFKVTLDGHMRITQEHKLDVL